MIQNLLSIKICIQSVSGKLRFDCQFCGRDFGDDVIGLARHIGKLHDPAR